MDANRFDALSRTLSQTPSRRGALRLLAGSTLGGLLTLGGAETEAHNALRACMKKSGKQKKKCRKKAQKHNASHTASPPPTTASPPPTGVSCTEGQTVCGGMCVILTTDPRNCGACGTRCRVNEQCVDGQCRCPSLQTGTCDGGKTCCPTPNSCNGCVCRCSFDQYVDPATCAEVTNCPSGSTPCSAPSGSHTCGITESGPSKVCCPSGTTCDTSTGTCLQ